MKVVLNEKNLIKAIAPCIVQLEKGQNFFPCALALTEVDFLLFSDYEPDSVKDNQAMYDVKIRLSIDSMMSVVLETIKKNSGLTPYVRMHLINRVIEDCVTIYFLKEDKSKMKYLLKQIKKTGIRVRKRKVYESKIY